MASRQAGLIRLTHDHHHTLAQARRLKQARAGKDPATVTRAADDFVNFYLGRTRRHFHEEEELFFAPLVDHEVVGPLVARAVADHLRLHAQLRTLRGQLSDGEVVPGVLERIAEHLESHVRFEEKELFPLLEQAIPESELLDLATAAVL